MTLHEERFHEVVEGLRRAGYRITPQRLAVVRALLATEAHPSAEQIYTQLQPAFPTMSLATVYKTIETLKGLGQVVEVEFKDGGTRYDARSPAPHPHLICSRCGRIQDLMADPFSSEVRAALDRSGFAMARFRFDLYGVCESCQERTAAATR